MKLTREQLDQALASVLGTDVVKAIGMNGSGRIILLESAINRAFTYGDGSLEDHDVLRQAQKELDADFSFGFEH